MCYPYFRLLNGAATLSLPRPAFPPDRGVPLLYLFGGHKRCLFHTSDFLARIEEASRHSAVVAASRWAELPDAGHWLHCEQPDSVHVLLEKFLAAVAAVENR